MRFGVIVPIYNVEPYLRKCLNSILAQSYQDYELILVDDGSLDHCPQICDEYAQKDNRIHVIHKKNGGLVSARQAGAAASAGQYIICIDGDDWVDTDYFAAVDKILNQYRPDIIALSYIYENNNRHILCKNIAPSGYYNKTKLNNIDKKTLFMNWELVVTLWSKVIIRNLYIEQQLKVDPRICVAEDYVCVLACFLQAESIYITEKAYYHYRCTENSLIHSFRPKAFDELKHLVAYLEKVLDDKSSAASKLVDEFIVHQIKEIHRSAYFYANYRRLKEIRKGKSAKELTSRLLQSDYLHYNKKKSVKLLLGNRWWLHYFIDCILRPRLNIIKNYCKAILKRILKNTIKQQNIK